MTLNNMMIADTVRNILKGCFEFPCMDFVASDKMHVHLIALYLGIKKLILFNLKVVFRGIFAKINYV